MSNILGTGDGLWHKVCDKKKCHMKKSKLFSKKIIINKMYFSILCSKT